MRITCSFVAIVLAAALARAQTPEHLPTIEERTSAMHKIGGYFPLYWEENSGKLWLEIPRFKTEFLLVTGLAAGLGSNDIGLDRGQENDGKVVAFERVGRKIMLVERNLSFRSSSSNAAERVSVEDSFAKSILWGFEAAAETDGRVLVDAGDFFVRDGAGAGTALSGHTTYKVDAKRSAVYLDRTKAFPKNTEVEVTLTFACDPPSGAIPSDDSLFSGSIGSVTPTAEAVTLREHYSLVELPDGNYQPRLDRSARRLLRRRLRGLQCAHRRSNGAALHPAAPAGEEGS